MISIRRCLIFAWMLAGLRLLSAGQNPPTQSAPTQTSAEDSSRAAPATALSAMAGIETESGGEDAGGDLPHIPALLGGNRISLAFASEGERSNYLRGGVNVGAIYDSNPLLLSSATESNTSESIFPNIKLEQSSSRMRLALGYAGGLTVNQKITNQNQGSHNLNFDSLYRLSPHVNLHVAENFSITTGFFDPGNDAAFVAGTGGPNLSLIAPLSTQRSSVTTVEANYQFALNDLVGASGSFYDLHFTNVPGGASVTNSQTATGSAFWLHRIVGPDWGGASYRFDRITFNVGGGETQVHSFLAINSVSFSKRFTLVSFIGPQYSENQGLLPLAGQPTTSNDWSLAGGTEAGWRDQHTSLSAGYSRITSDGAGVLGTVRLQSVYFNLRRQLTPGWAAGLNVSHGTNQSMIVPTATSANSANLTSVGVSLERNVGRSFGLRMGYSHDFQQEFGVPGSTQTSPLQTFDASRDRFFVTLSYQWAKPIGM